MEPLTCSSSRRDHEIPYGSRSWKSFRGKCITHHVRGKNQRGLGASDGTNVSSNSQDESGNSGTTKCPAQLPRNTLPWKSPAPGKCQYYSFGQIVLPILPACLCLQHQFSWHHGNSHDCASSVYHDWNEVICLAQYRITSSKLETFLARQRPVLQCQLFECMDKIVHPLLTSNGAIAASVACSCLSELLFN